jgi:hypothetical protein
MLVSAFRNFMESNQCISQAAFLCHFPVGACGRDLHVVPQARQHGPPPGPQEEPLIAPHSCAFCSDYRVVLFEYVASHHQHSRSLRTLLIVYTRSCLQYRPTCTI